MPDRPGGAEWDPAEAESSLQDRVPGVDAQREYEGGVPDVAVGSLSRFWKESPLPGMVVLSGVSGDPLRLVELGDESIVGSSLALLNDGGVVIGGGWLGSNRHAENEGYVAVLDSFSDLRWMVRAEELRPGR